LLLDISNNTIYKLYTHEKKHAQKFHIALPVRFTILPGKSLMQTAGKAGNNRWR
jgi:hypothetical protein